MKTHIIIIICIIATLGFACGEENSVVFPPRPTGMSITAQVVPSHVQIGHNSELTLTVINHGPKTIELNFDGADHFGFRIETLDGTLVTKFPKVYLPDDHVFQMKPGYAKTNRWILPGNLVPQHYIVKTGILEHEDEYPWIEIRWIVHL